VDVLLCAAPVRTAATGFGTAPACGSNRISAARWNRCCAPSTAASSGGMNSVCQVVATGGALRGTTSLAERNKNRTMNAETTCATRRIPIACRLGANRRRAASAPASNQAPPDCPLRPRAVSARAPVAANLAMALAQAGHTVGLLDVDVHGPSIPKLLGLEGANVENDGAGLFPVSLQPNLKVMSMVS